jgi:hypothetical protein
MRVGSRVTRQVRNVGRDDHHLSAVEDGCGCLELWEHLSDRRGDG